ncbi:MAG: Tn3 family transposase [Candidatus Sulfotelmatobacter sp.]
MPHIPAKKTVLRLPRTWACCADSLSPRLHFRYRPSPYDSDGNENKSEAFNLFVQWVAFGGGRLLAENTRDEQRKMIKYHHLVANLLIFHNVVTMTKALQLLMEDGNPIDEEALACLSPYQTEHINRFGRYALKRDRVPEPLDRVRVLRMPPQSEGVAAEKYEKIKKSVTF